MKVSLRLNVILRGWLGWKHQLTEFFLLNSLLTKLSRALWQIFKTRFFLFVSLFSHWEVLASHENDKTVFCHHHWNICRLTLKPRSGELRTQKLKSHLMRTQSLNILPLKPGVGQCIGILATLTARDFFLAHFYPSSIPLHFFQKPLPVFSCVGSG